MTIQELTQKINESILSEIAKQKILAVINTYTEVTSELEDQVKDLIQEDIDQDFASVGIDENTPDIQAVQDQLEKDLHHVDQELDEDLSIMNSELESLNDLRKELNSSEEEHAIAQLRADLTA